MNRTSAVALAKRLIRERSSKPDSVFVNMLDSADVPVNFKGTVLRFTLRRDEERGNGKNM